MKIPFLTLSPLVQGIFLLFTAQLGINFYLAALPALAENFAVSKDAIIASLYLYLLAYGGVQLLVPILKSRSTDARVLQMAFVFYMVGLLFLIFSTHLSIFYLGRALQGLGAGILSLMVKVILQKNYKDAELLRAFAILEAVAILVPCLAPLLGGFLMGYFSFKALFWISMVFSILSGVLVLKTNQAEVLQQKIEQNHFLIYAQLFKNKALMLNCLRLFLLYGMILMSLSSLPFLLQSWGKSPTVYGYFQMGLGLSIFLGTYWIKKATAAQQENALNKYPFLLLLLALFFYPLSAYFHLHLGLAFFFFFVVHIIYGAFFPFYMSKALNKIDFPAHAAALMGCIQLAGASFLQLLIQPLFEDKIMLIACTWGWAACFLFFSFKKIDFLLKD